MRNRRNQEESEYELDEEVLEDINWDSRNLPKSKMEPVKYDFMEVEEEEPATKLNKLPVINPRFSGKTVSETKPSSQIRKPTEVTKLSSLKKQPPKDDFLNEDILDEEQRTTQNKYRKATPPKKEPEPQAQDYEQDFEADDYGEDFEEFKEEVETNKEEPSSVQTIPKKVSIFRKNNSRQSLRSGKSQKRSTTVNASKPKEQIDRYQKQVERAFPSGDLKSFQVDKLNKLNEKIRTMIRRFNEQLNDIINKNAVIIRMKENSNQLEKTIEEKLKVLEEEKKNNAKMLERMELEIDRMRYRQGEIREDDYELEMHKRVDVLKDKIKDLDKVIVRLKLEMENEGKRLYTNVQRKDNEVNASIKSQLVHFKKEEVKTNEYITKLDEKISDMETKNGEVDYRLAELIKEAEDKGVDLNPHSPKKAKFDELVKRRDNEKKMVAVTEGQMKVRRDRLGHDMQLMTRELHHLDLEIKNLYNDIDHSLQKSRSLIKKNKELQKVPSNVAVSLENLERSLVVPILTDFYEFKLNRSRVVANTSRARVSSASNNKRDLATDKRMKSKEELLPLNPKMVAKSVVEDREDTKPQTDKPQLKKKQQKQQKGNAYERIWKDNEENDAQQTPVVVSPKATVQEHEASPPAPLPPTINDDSKPKFMLKRRGNNPPEPQPLEQSKPKLKEQIKLVAEEKEPVMEQPKPSDVEKPFSLGRNRIKKIQNSGYAPSEQPSAETTTSTKPIQKPVQPEVLYDAPRPKLLLGGEENSESRQPTSTFQTQVPEDKPMIAPKRMLMRKRGTEQELASGYNPTFNEPKPAQQIPPTVDSKPVNNPYAPKAEQKPVNNPYAPPPTQSQVKPNNPYAPPAAIPSPTNNPYAPTNNPYAPKTDTQPYQSQREGRLKKPKVQLPKQKYNIYEAAEEDHNEVNEFMAASKAPYLPTVTKAQAVDEQPDLNKLLGINQPRAADPEDQLLFGRNEQPKRQIRIRRPADADPY